MTGINIFNQILKDPANFEISGPERKGNPQASKSLQDRLGTFLSTLEDFTADYAHEYQYGGQEYDEGEYDHFQVEPDEAANIELFRFRADFLDYIIEAAVLLNCDTEDILLAHGFDNTDVYNNFAAIIHNDEFTDSDAIRILQGIHSEVSVLSEQLSTGKRSAKTAIDMFLSENDDGMMYDEPESP